MKKDRETKIADLHHRLTVVFFNFGTSDAEKKEIIKKFSLVTLVDVIKYDAKETSSLMVRSANDYKNGTIDVNEFICLNLAAFKTITFKNEVVAAYCCANGKDLMAVNRVVGALLDI